MGFKKRNKVNAQFNMSSLTDIIFLLLIFFMLTSSLVAPNALNLKLPGKSESTTPQTEQLPSVMIEAGGVYKFNGQQVSAQEIDRRLREIANRSASQRSFTISHDKEAGVEHVVYVMDAANRYKLNAVLLMDN